MMISISPFTPHINNFVPSSKPNQVTVQSETLLLGREALFGGQLITKGKDGVLINGEKSQVIKGDIGYASLGEGFTFDLTQQKVNVRLDREAKVSGHGSTDTIVTDGDDTFNLPKNTKFLNSEIAGNKLIIELKLGDIKFASTKIEVPLNKVNDFLKNLKGDTKAIKELKGLVQNSNPIVVEGDVKIGLGAVGAVGSVLPKDGRLVSTSTQGSLAIAQGATATVSLRNDKANTIEFGGNREGAPGSTTTILVGANDVIDTKTSDRLGSDVRNQKTIIVNNVQKDGSEFKISLKRGENIIHVKAKSLDDLKKVIENSRIDEVLKTKLLKGVENMKSPDGSA